MRQDQEDLTRTLASALWRSAFSPYCRALDNWLAAEAMVAEALIVARQQPAPGADAAAAAPGRSLPPSALPVESVRDLAQCFWEHSMQSTVLTLDIWLAAERHVRAVCRAALSGRLAQPFSAQAYWRRIRDHAEGLWHEQGRPQDRDLETWLQAESEVLEAAAGGDAPPVQATPGEARDGDRGADRNRSHAGARRPLALTMLPPREDGAPAAGSWYSSAVAENSGPQPGL